MRRALPLLLLAAACATSRAARQDAEALACGRGDSASCARRGLRALAGEGVPRDERDAAAWLMAACERGHGQSCADLGALYAAGRGVRQDHGRACELGLADACARAGRPAPMVVRVPGLVPPAAPLPEPPPARGGPDLQRALLYAELYVPARYHQALGLTRASLEVDPPAPEEDVELVRPVLEARSARVASCLPPPASLGGRAAAKASAMLTFVLTGDGRVTGVAVADYVSRGAWLLPADCVRAAVTPWEFPRPRAGGRMWLEVAGDAPEEVPQAADAGQTLFPPREKTPGCIAGSIGAPPGTATVRIDAKFFVDADGRASDFVLVTKAEDGRAIAFARTARRAVYSCAFVPGTDGNGAPVGLWVVQGFRVTQ